MSKFRISIVVPIYNTEKYLERCINSILNQSYSNIELILVDDGSTDGSGEICDRLAYKDKRVKVIHTKNNGLSKARNIGIEHSTGSYIAFVDSDDYIHEDMYNDMVKIIKNNDVDIVYCNYLEGSLDKYRFNKYKDLKIDIFDSKKILELSYKKESSKYLVVWNKLIKKQIINDIKFDEDIKIGEDHIFCNKIYNKAKKIGYINNQYYYYYRGNENSVCNDNKNIEKRMDQIRSYIKEYKYFSKENPQILNLVIMRILYTIRFRLDMAIERNDLKNKKECELLLKEWHKILLENKNISTFEKIIITLNVRSKLYKKIKLIIYNTKKKIIEFI